MNTGPNFSYWQIFFPVLCLVIYLSLWGESKQKCWRVVTQQWRRKMNTPCDCKHSHNLRSETLLNQVRRKKKAKEVGGEKWRERRAQRVERWKDRDQSTNGGQMERAGKSWNRFSHYNTHLQFFRNFGTFFPIAEVCCQEGSYRKDLGSIIPFCLKN